MDYRTLQQEFGNRLRLGEPLARLTVARLGGPADAFIEAHNSDDLAVIVRRLWELEMPYVILGGGSNLLVSDDGVRGVVVLNKARQVRFYEEEQEPRVWAESGANFGALARQAASKGLGGLEWAAGIPGTLGGAVFGNAGAHGGDMRTCLELAEILHHIEAPEIARKESWIVERLGYAYRSSELKRHPGKAVVLSAVLKLQPSTPAEAQARIEEFVAYRRRTQPPGASLGSMFKNPPGDYAGRLIEAAGLKGTRVGGAEISPVHANFFINLGGATAADLYDLVVLARQKVAEKFGIALELEIELVGEFEKSAE